MPVNYTDDQLRLAARLYYLDGLGQAEVAKFVKVSQAKISRLLSMARERGIVRISVAEYEPRHTALEKKLCKRFGLRAAAVMKTVGGSTAEDARRTTGHFGAAFVHSLVPEGSTVAIAGGRTMRELIQMLPEEPVQDLTVIQAMGSIDSTVGPVDALELGRQMAQRWSGSFMTINTPAFVPDKATRDSFLALQQIRAVWLRFKTVDVALVGVGTLENSIFMERGILSARDVEELRECGTVGEICGRFFDQRGRECRSAWSERVMSMGLEQLRKTPQVIGIVSGTDRSEALVAAIRSGILKSLVIDENGAKALLEVPN
jgi:deoxyribonucleoside regulator